MKCLVTGAAGFIGSALAKRLTTLGHDVTGTDDFSSAAWSNLIDFGGEFVTADVATDFAPIARLGPFEVIFHQASITDTTVSDQRRMMHNNLEGFRSILQSAAHWKSRVIWASSASIYGQGPAPMKESQTPQPLNVYAFSKLAMERLAERYRTHLAHPIVGLRYFNVYGPGEDHKGKFASMIHQLAVQMRSGRRPRIFTAGQQRRDFVYIEDVIQANLKGMNSEEAGVFNVGSGGSASFNDVVGILNLVLKTNLPPDYFENPYSFTQDWTEADLASSRGALGYVPKFDLLAGITAYHSTGKLGFTHVR